MDQYCEEDVKKALAEFHPRLRRVVLQGHREWVDVADYRAEKGFPPVLYSRTVANHVFDAIARAALAEFGNDPRVRIIEEPQTIKCCFDQKVVARFKKANGNGIGQNHPTQAVLAFIDPQATLPGIPPEAAKIEIVWVENDIGRDVERITVVARDQDYILWSYDIDDEEFGSGAIPFPSPETPDDDDFPLVVVKRTPSRQESE